MDIQERLIELRGLYIKYPEKRDIILRQVRSLEIASGMSLIKDYNQVKMKLEVEKNEAVEIDKRL